MKHLIVLYNPYYNQEVIEDHIRVLNQDTNILGLPEKEEVKLVFIYPSHAESKNIVLNDVNLVDANFEKIYKIPIYIPAIGEH